jgi:predicted permease
MTDAICRDLRYVVRSLRREPVFLVAVIVLFAVAVGTNAAMFGLVSRLMLSAPPGIQGADRVARLEFQLGDAAGGSAMSTTSYPVFRAMRDVPSFRAVAMARSDTVSVGQGADLTPVAAVQASGEYFSVLGAMPALGRFFGASDDELPLGNPVAVLSHAYWERQFASDRAVLGRDINIDGARFTIVGVAERGFNGDALSAVDVFMPLTAAMAASPGWTSNTGMLLGTVLVRLRDGVAAPAAAQLATRALARERVTDESPAIRIDPVIPGAASRESPQARVALWLTGVSLIVLLIAAANTGTLLLLRGERRRRDTAVRIAVGASVRDIARQLVVESALITITGAAAGLLATGWFSEIMRVTLLPSLARSERVVDARLWIVSLAVAVLTGVVAGLSPLLQLRRRDVNADLRGAGIAAPTRLGFQRLLIGLQVALCTVLLVGAGLFVRSLDRVQSQDLGFTTTGLLHVTLEFRQDMPDAERDRVYEEAVQRLHASSGVVNATPVAGVPFGPHNIPPISVPGWNTPPPWEAQLPIMYGATPEYLAMMRVAPVQGRLFSAADRRGSALVVLVNESMARTVWPGQSPIGRCVRAGYYGAFPPVDDANPADRGPCREVIGVVRDSRARSLKPEGGEGALMQYYVPMEQLPPAPVPTPTIMGLLVQVRGDVERASPAIQRLLQGTIAVPVYARVRAYQDFMDPQLRSWRLGATLFSVFSSLALVIAAIGLFAVIAYLVQQRTREFGVRLALGATRVAMGRMVLRDGLALVTVGVAIGAAAALLAVPVVRGMLFQTSPYEPANFVVALLVLVGVTVVASLWPAWRASAVDPMIALRSDV